MLHFTSARPTPRNARPSTRARRRTRPTARARAASRAAGAARRARPHRLDQRRRANYVAERLDVAPADVYGVATFYALLSDDAPRRARRSRLRRHRVHDAGARRTLIARTLAARRARRWLRSPCLGLCDRAPAALVERRRAPCQSATRDRPGDARARQTGAVTTATRSRRRLGSAAAAPRRRSIPRASTPIAPTAATWRCEAPSSSDRGRHRARSPHRSCRGAAAPPSPTGRKMEAVAQASGEPHYLVCNADESEPGTFKDRVLMEHDPFALVEAMTIAGLRDRLRARLLYVRGEYPLAAAALENAIARARAAGLLGDDVMGRGIASTSRCGAAPAPTSAARRPRSSTRSKANAANRATSRRFPCRWASSASRRSQQRRDARESLPIVLRGRRRVRAHRHRRLDRHAALLPLRRRARARASTRSRTARRSARSSRSRAASRDGRSAAGVLLGGAAGTFVEPEALTMPLTFEDARAAGATLGSGVVMLFDDRADPARTSSADRRVLPRGVVRAMRALPRRHRAPGRGARTRKRSIGRRPTSSTTSAARCATPPSAVWAKRPRARSRPHSAFASVELQSPACLRDRSSSPSTASPCSVAEGATILDACKHAGDRNADALLPRERSRRSTPAASASSSSKVRACSSGLRAPRRDRA